MTIRDIKAAINAVIVANGGTVWSTETDEGFIRPAYFVEVVPVKTTRITPVYDECELSVEIHYEPLIETESQCLRVADLIDQWFSEPIILNEERVIKPPDEISHTIEDGIVLYSDFNITITKIHNESIYQPSPSDPYMEILDLNNI